VDEYEERTGAYRGFADQLTQIHGPQGNDSDSESDDWYQEWYDSDEYKKIRMQFQPQPKSYKAQLMYGGANQLACVMMRVAQTMFPRLVHEEIVMVRSESLWKKHQDEINRNNPHRSPCTEEGEELSVVVPKYKWIIDFVRIDVEPVETMVEHFRLEEDIWAVVDHEFSE
jgi:hypothetical protein